MSTDPDQIRRPTISLFRRWEPLHRRANLLMLGGAASGGADTFDLQEVANTPCLILLADPGAGKTWELEQLASGLRENGKRADFVRGNDIADEQDFAKLFASGNFSQWMTEGGEWHVLIDDVDEITGPTDRARPLAMFLDWLRAERSNRRSLFVAMTCRTASWNSETDELVDARWSGEDIRKLTLRPLEESDVRTAVLLTERDPEKQERLTEMLLDDNLGSLTERPLFLTMMLDRYRVDRELPGTQTALFRGAIEHQLIATGDRSSAVDPARMRLLAGRIAAASAFSGLDRITTSLAREAADTLVVNRIAGGSETSSRGAIIVTPADLVEVLRSDLFTLVEPGVYQFSHRVFRDFLGAQYLVDHRLSVEQLISLLTVRELNGTGSVAPQLREMAAWAAAMIPDLFEALVSREPDVLLTSDAAAMKPADRARLTAAVLARFAAGDLLQQHAELVPLFARLDHDGLADQLKEFIGDPAALPSVRMIAIDIARAVEERALVPALLDTALDRSSDVLVRTWAVRAVGHLGSEGDRDRLVPILMENLAADEEDRLRGALLTLCWPAHLDFGELFSALTPPKKRNYIGLYHIFLRRLSFPFPTEDLVVDGLRWLRSQLAMGMDREQDLRSVMARLFWALAGCIGDAGVRSAMADLVVEAENELSSFLVRYRENGEDWAAQSEFRTAFVAEILSRSSDPLRSTSAVLYLLPDLVRNDDLADYLSQLRRASSHPVRSSLAHIIVDLAGRLPLDELTDVWEAAEEVPELHALLASRFTVDIFSEAAEVMRRQASYERKLEEEKEKTALGETKRHDAIKELLDRIDAGAPGLWWQLNLELMRDASGFRSEFEFNSDLTATPGWKMLDEQSRKRVVATASRYLLEAPLTNTDWLGTDTSHRPANAGVRAFRLLSNHDADQLGRLPVASWAAWAPALLGFFANDFDEAGGAQSALLREAYRQAPDAVLDAVRKIALNPRSAGLASRSFELLADIVDPALVDTLEDLRGNPELRGEKGSADILAFLARIGANKAIEEVLTALRNGKDSDNTPSMVRAAAELILEGSAEAWNRLIELRAGNETFARALWREIADEAAFAAPPILAYLDAYSLGQGYIDLAELLPERPPVLTGPRVLTVPDHVERLRTMIIGRLVDMGTNSSLQQLERIIVSLPAERDGLSWRLNDARQKVRARSAVRPDPYDFLLLVQGMGEEAGPPAGILPASVDDFHDAETDGVTIETDIPAPEPKPAGELPEGEKRTILAAATDWASAKGGISTLNRNLCRALAALGHRVICLVPRALPNELDDALKNGVVLIASRTSEGIEDEDSFLLCEEADLACRPDIVIGHDHITGPVARALATRFGAKYVHFLHTIPQENENLKMSRNGKPRRILTGEEKLRAQARMADASDLVAAVGPRIYRTFAHEAPEVKNLFKFLPGLSDDLLMHDPDPAEIKVNQCLLVGRMEDAAVKGLELACEFMKAVVEGGWSVGQSPKLRIRGFSEDHADEEIQDVANFREDYGSFVSPRTYSTDTAALRIELVRSALFVMPSRAEGFGLAGFEAIAAGIPVIVSDESGLAEFLNDEEKNGLLSAALVSPCVGTVVSGTVKNIEDWRSKADDVLRNHVDAFKRADRIRNALRTKYTWDRAARELSAQLCTL